MKNTIIAAACALALSTSFAIAQPSQAQGGASTGPTSNSQNSQSSQGMMNNTGGSGMNSGTTGSGMTSGSGTMQSGGGAMNKPMDGTSSSQGNVGPGTDQARSMSK